MLTAKQIEKLTVPYSDKHIAIGEHKVYKIKVGDGVWTNMAGHICFFEDVPPVLCKKGSWDRDEFERLPLEIDRIKALEAKCTTPTFPVEVRGNTDDYTGKACTWEVRFTDGQEETVWVDGRYLACLIRRGAVSWLYDGQRVLLGRAADGRSVGLLTVLYDQDRYAPDWSLCNEELSQKGDGNVDQ